MKEYVMENFGCQTHNHFASDEKTLYRHLLNTRQHTQSQRCRGSDVQDDDHGVVNNDADNHVYGSERSYGSELSPRWCLPIYIKYDTCI